MVTAIQDELKQKDESGSENGNTGAGAKEAVTTAPATMGVGQPGKPGKAKSGSGFVNLERYLVGNPNAGQQMASQISGVVKGAGEAYKTTGQSLVKGAQDYASKDVTTVKPDVLEKIRGGTAQTINPEDTSFAGLGGYTGSEGYKQQSKTFEGQGQTFRNLAETAKTPGLAVPNIIHKNRPVAYTSKMGALDTAFMSTPEAQSQFSGLQSYLGGFGADFGGGGATRDLGGKVTSQLGDIAAIKQKEAEDTQRAIQEAARAGSETARGGIAQGLGSRQAGLRQQLIDDAKLQYRTQTGQELDDATAAQMINITGQDLSGASQQEMENLNALRTMAGEGAVEAAPAITGTINQEILAAAIDKYKKDWAAKEKAAQDALTTRGDWGLIGQAMNAPVIQDTNLGQAAVAPTGWESLNAANQTEQYTPASNPGGILGTIGGFVSGMGAAASGVSNVASSAASGGKKVFDKARKLKLGRS